MSRYANRILVIFLPVLFFGLLSAQERVQETRLLVTTESNMYDPSGGLGSKLFAYTRYDPAFWRNKVYRVEDGKKRWCLNPAMSPRNIFTTCKSPEMTLASSLAWLG